MQAGPVRPVRDRGGADDGELGGGFVRIGGERAGQRARVGQFVAEQGHPLRFGERQIVALHAGAGEQFGDDAFVHGAVLPQVECREMEAERLHRADQAAECSARRERSRPAVAQAASDADEVGAQRLRIGIRLARQPPGARRGLAGERLVRGGEARVDPRQGAAIGLVAAAFGGVAARFGEREDGRVDMGVAAGDRQLGTQRVERVEIMADHRLACEGKRAFERLRGDEGIAVAIAADPAARPHERGHALAERAIPPLVEGGQRREEHVAQVGQGGLDLVGDVEPFAPEHARLPQQRDLTDDCLFHVVALGRLGGAGIADRHQFGDAVAMVDHRLAAHLGRVSGEHGGDQRVIEQREHGVAVDPLAFEPSERVGDIGALLRGDALAVLGQIGEHGEEHEAASEAQHLVQVERAQLQVDLSRAGTVAFHRSGADVLRAAIHLLAAICADDVAEQLAQVTDVGIVGDEGKRGHLLMLRCGIDQVNRVDARRSGTSLHPLDTKGRAHEDDGGGGGDADGRVWQAPRTRIPRPRRRRWTWPRRRSPIDRCAGPTTRRRS